MPIEGASSNHFVNPHPHHNRSAKDLAKRVLGIGLMGVDLAALCKSIVDGEISPIKDGVASLTVGVSRCSI